MEIILKQIDAALESGLYYLAVATTLTLPDICAALESRNGATTPDRYKAWYEKWLGEEYPIITADDMYALRCGVSHQGRAGRRGVDYSRIVFVIPHVSQTPASSWHRQISDQAGERVLCLDAAFFCTDVMKSVQRWYADRANDPNVLANLPRLLQYRPRGLPPHFVGPVIA
jgi:hypothetical protein